MCMSCGCCIPSDNHDQWDNITYNTLLKAMIAGNVTTMEQLIENIEETYASMQIQTSQAVKPAAQGVNDDMGPTGTNEYASDAY